MHKNNKANLVGPTRGRRLPKVSSESTSESPVAKPSGLQVATSALLFSETAMSGFITSCNKYEQYFNKLPCSNQYP